MASSPSTFSSGNATKNSSSKNTTNNSTLILRLIFVGSLFVSAAICGIVSYAVVDQLERSVGLQTYDSIAKIALQNAQSITKRKVVGSQVIASIMGNAFPYATEWPFVALEGYVETANKVAALTGSLTQAVNVLVQPDQVEQFNAHAKQVYKDQGYPETAGVNPDTGEFGIWKREGADRTRVLDTTGETTYNSTREPNNILIPIFQHNSINAGSILFNVHSVKVMGSAIDRMLDCVEEAQQATTTAEDECVVVSDFFELIRTPGPAALLYVPILARRDNQIVAVAASSVNWAEVLTNVVPDYVDGLDCIVSDNKGNSYTYVINQGVPQLKGEGDLHDTKFDDKAYGVVLNDFLKNQGKQQDGATGTTSTTSVQYTLTVYPTDVMLDEFRTNSPLVIGFGFVAVILLCATIFAVYDYLMRGESRQQKAVLRVKRQFVRFVSHEIRTPLNTCCLGLELLLAELGENNSNNNTTKAQQSSSNSSYLLDLTSDILDNAESAVTILNDLLNYDKIETGSFQLEVGVVPIWELVQKTVQAFDIQARKRNVQLKFHIHDNNTTGNEEEDVENNNNGSKIPDSYSSLNVVGDDMRLRQVVLNIVSNALKFVEEGTGTIDVTASFQPNGLPGERTLVANKDGLKTDQAYPISYPRKGAIQLDVRDNGAGMSQDQLNLMFREGVQFDANKLQAGGGSGLGMYITKGLIEQHGGCIQVMSEGQGLGTTFTVLLPLYICHSDQTTSTGMSDYHDNVMVVSNGGDGDGTNPNNKDAKEAMAVAGEEPLVVKIPEKLFIQQRRVLVVDDAAMNRKMLIRLLERAGHSCDSAANGQEAVDAIVKDQEHATMDENYQPYDTILMDFEMPVMNGPDATNIIRSKGCKAFIVGVTGNVLLEDVNHFKSKGADLVLAKPLKVTALEEAWLSKTGKKRANSSIRLSSLQQPPQQPPPPPDVLHS